MYIATLGSDYMSAVDYAITKGFVGSNIDLRIYIDQGIDEKLLKKQLRQHKWLFGEIRIFLNRASKDIGVPIDQIQLIETRIA